MMEQLLLCHMISYSIGCVIDLIVGDPYWMPHPIRWIGNLISFLDRLLCKPIETDEHGNVVHDKRKERLSGLLLVIIVLAVTVLCSLAIICFAYYIHAIVGIVVESILTAYILAAKSLKVESMKVYKELKADNLEGARYAVSMIVGRDTASLDESGVTKAAVETIAENTSDGVIAPLIYTAIGGPVMGLLYKAINTCDSMIGYHNDKYEYMGTVAARLDDVVNFIPARISAFLMIIASVLLGSKYSASDAYRIFKRDRYNHKSPNSAQTESVCAGALGIRLAGDASYFGKIVHKPTIGDENRKIEIEDIKSTNKLMYATAMLGYICGMIIIILFMFIS